MNHGILALAGLALIHSAPGTAAQTKSDPAPSEAPHSQSLEAGRSEAGTRVANWVASSNDNAALPYIVIDKPSAAMFLYDAKNKLLAQAPVLLGIALGDEATPGIGAKNLSEIGPAEKTTPAGRFLAKFGVAAGRQKVLWVDYATSVAIHTLPPGNSQEKRRERILSKTIDDNRVTFGCINVPKVAYAKIRQQFGKKGGYVYVVPDTKPVEEVFPPLHAVPVSTR